MLELRHVSTDHIAFVATDHSGSVCCHSEHVRVQVGVDLARLLTGRQAREPQHADVAGCRTLEYRVEVAVQDVLHHRPVQAGCHVQRQLTLHHHQ